MTTLTLTARKTEQIAQQKTSCLVLPIFEGAALNDELTAVNSACDDIIKRNLALGDFTGKAGTKAELTGNTQAKRILLVGCGDSEGFDQQAQRKFASTAAKAMAAGKYGDALVSIASLPVDAVEGGNLLEMLARQLCLATYVYTETLSKPKDPPALKKVTVNAGSIITSAKAKQHLAMGQAVGNGANFTRELVNLPGNVCTPSYLANQARALAKRHSKVSATVLDEKKMKELGMGSLLSVGNGSDEPSKLIVMEYKGGKAKEAPYALVGKGITFDTGGISLKPGPKMDEMKFDMGGAGAVFGTLQAVADMGLPINVVGVVAAAENMPSGRATKPGDVVTSMSGKTIEILNTDAEGRLVLCDALTYVGRYKPCEVVDIATLTGAIIVALGNHASGVFANDDALAQDLVAAGNRADDRAWQLPVWQDYQKQLDSPFADVANIGVGGGNAGSITAACFLARFTEEYRWAHMDIAGTAFSSSPKGATGRPVPLLVDYLRQRAGR